jgi:hypothetical protein
MGGWGVKTSLLGGWGVKLPFWVVGGLNMFPFPDMQEYEGDNQNCGNKSNKS